MACVGPYGRHWRRSIGPFFCLVTDLTSGLVDGGRARPGTSRVVVFNFIISSVSAFDRHERFVHRGPLVITSGLDDGADARQRQFRVWVLGSRVQK